MTLWGAFLCGNAQGGVRDCPVFGPEHRPGAGTRRAHSVVSSGVRPWPPTSSSCLSPCARARLCCSCCSIGFAARTSLRKR